MIIGIGYNIIMKFIKKLSKNLYKNFLSFDLRKKLMKSCRRF
jgi:hypothetical protein